MVAALCQLLFASVLATSTQADCIDDCAQRGMTFSGTELSEDNQCECQPVDIEVNAVNDGEAAAKMAQHVVVVPVPPPPSTTTTTGTTRLPPELEEEAEQLALNTLARMQADAANEKKAKEQRTAELGRSNTSPRVSCFLHDVRWSPALTAVYKEVADVWDCQRQCQQNEACAHFTYSSLYGECTMHGHRAVLHHHANVAAGYVSGPKVCFSASSAGPIFPSSSAPWWLLWLSLVLFCGAGMGVLAFLVYDGRVDPALWSSLRGNIDGARGRELLSPVATASGDEQPVEVAPAAPPYLPMAFTIRVPAG
eukprot:NODE_10804_length_1328_cov_4.649459.p1 GENE.NODE_10804_length_1328_cov_4.649459~~NODE_10804_length_1328_cov_4.649459.p1  ORF type:complete len:350 (-),score=76.35 NODE_10804_length_1328_cov_4.649459:279-1205(-)